MKVRAFQIIVCFFKGVVWMVSQYNTILISVHQACHTLPGR